MRDFKKVILDNFEKKRSNENLNKKLVIETYY